MKVLRLVLLSLLIPIGIQTNAQTFKPGILAGVVTSTVGGDSYGGFNKIGVTIGGYVRYNIRDNWSTQFEIYYVQKGSRNSFSINENDPNQSSTYFMFRMNYIEIPLLLRFNHRKFVYEAGLYYSQLVGFYMEYRDDLFNQSGPYTTLDQLNSLLSQGGDKTFSNYDFGGVIGVGYKMSDKVLFSVRLTNSILPIKTYDSNYINYYPTQVNYGWTHTVIAGTLRYTFGQGDE